MHACMHACMHTCIHAYMHTCIHAYMHTCIHAYMHTCIHTCMHTCIHTCMHTYMHAYIHACMHTCIHTTWTSSPYLPMLNHHHKSRDVAGGRRRHGHRITKKTPPLWQPPKTSPVHTHGSLFRSPPWQHCYLGVSDPTRVP